MILNSAQCCMAEGVRRVTREKLESLILTDDDMLAPNPFHNRSLYVEAEICRVAGTSTALYQVKRREWGRYNG